MMTIGQAKALAAEFAGADPLDPQLFAEYLLGELKMERQWAAFVLWQIGRLQEVNLKRAGEVAREVQRISELPPGERIRAALDSEVL